MSCIFTRELNREPQQYSTNYLYKVLIVHATLNLAYSKEHIVNILYNVIVLEPSTFFCMIHDHIIVTVIVCNIMLIPDPKFKIKK